MKRVLGLERNDLGGAARVVAVGAFDGVHLGHARILSQARREARQRGVEVAAMTFDPSPRELKDGVRQPGRRLTPVQEQLCLFEDLGLDLAVVLKFPGTIREMPPESFVSEVLIGKLNAVCLYASESHRFGAGRRGDIRLLGELARRFGVDLVAPRPQMVNDRRVSSTWVRELLAEGRVSEARELLGRPYAAFGEVMQGRGVGRLLGFPTANVRIPPEKFVPRDGVYAGVAARVTADYTAIEQPRPAAINIGTAPTFGRGQRVIEAHVIGPQTDLAGASLKLEFLSWLRAEQRFADEGALVRQIEEDVARAQALAEAVGGRAHEGHRP